VLRHKLRRLDAWNEARRELGAALHARIAQAQLTTSVEPVGRPFGGADHVYHLFVVRCGARDRLREHLERHGVASAIHYPLPIHRTEAYAELGLQAGSLPVSEALSEQICSLPLFPAMDASELERVAEAVETFPKDEPTQTR
jgi:dTDP-3-amino-3,4,6-trideoxy-alpha-D-glucose transaminase